jgi:hypothetical protein
MSHEVILAIIIAIISFIPSYQNALKDTYSSVTKEWVKSGVE